jgi:D-arabinose 1-dehydrogenase-like Zn-dependent alcohol dehydrogenase
MGYKNVLLFKGTVTHLQWLCELKRYLCYICRSQYQVICGRQAWQGSGGVSIMTSTKIVHGGYTPSTLANDIALLRLPTPLSYTSEYHSPVSLMLLCVYCGHMCSVFNAVACAYLSSRHPYDRFCYPQ